MIKPSDFSPLIPPLGPRPSAPAAARGTAPASPASWFDPTAVSGDVRISAELDPSTRGLSVEQHAQRVLAALCGEREPGA